MKVFISWSGERSLQIGKALHEWIPLVLQSVEPWMSQTSIDAGERWGSAVASSLDKTNFGIICVTPENMNSPWLLFEAGALAKSLESARVVPLLHDLDVKDLEGPLSQFQSKRLDKSHMIDILRSINNAQSQTIDAHRLDKSYAAHWEDLQEAIDAIPAWQQQDNSPLRSTNDVLEELVERVRSMQGLLERRPISATIPYRPLAVPQGAWAVMPLYGLSDLAKQDISLKLREKFPNQKTGLMDERLVLYGPVGTVGQPEADFMAFANDLIRVAQGREEY